LFPRVKLNLNTPSSRHRYLVDLRLVAEEDGQIPGFGVLDLGRSLINATYVSPKAVRRGIGRSLVEAMESAAKQGGVSQLHLNSTLNAVPFYERLGYVQRKTASNRLPTGVELHVGTPKRVSVGWGKDCTVTAIVLTNGSLQLNLLYESRGEVVDGVKTRPYSERSHSVLPAGLVAPAMKAKSWFCFPPMRPHFVVAMKPMVIP
jgi:GNAT superfamily N-acetyltransferase